MIRAVSIVRTLKVSKVGITASQVVFMDRGGCVRRLNTSMAEGGYVESSLRSVTLAFIEVSTSSTTLKSMVRFVVDRSFSSLIRGAAAEAPASDSTDLVDPDPLGAGAVLLRVRMPDPFWLFAEEWLFIAEDGVMVLTRGCFPERSAETARGAGLRESAGLEPDCLSGLPVFRIVKNKCQVCASTSQSQRLGNMSSRPVLPDFPKICAWR
jgi:hypothetical protein